MLINWKFIYIHSLDVKCLKEVSTFSAAEVRRLSENS